MVGHRPDRQRFSHSHPPRATMTPVPSAAMVTPASTLQDVPVSLDLSPEDFAGVPELLDFTLPGSDESHHESRETGCDLGIPHGPILQDTASTAQALSSSGGPKIRVVEIERGFQVALMQPLHTAL